MKVTAKTPLRTPLLLILVFLLPQSAWAIGADVIFKALQDVHEKICLPTPLEADPNTNSIPKPNPKTNNDAQCTIIKNRLKLFENPFYKKAIETFTQSMTQEIFCNQEIENIVHTWTLAATPLNRYDSASVLGSIFCIEQSKTQWTKECLTRDQNKTKEFLVPQHSCSVSTPAPNTFTPPQTVPMEIHLSPDCQHLFFEVPVGSGAYRTAFHRFEYTSWKDRVYVRFHKPLDQLTALERESLENELIFLNKIIGNKNIGIPEVFHADHTGIAVEPFQGELGKSTGEIPEFKNPGGWQQAASQLNSALSFIHGLGVLHRDLKPENTLVSARNSAVRPPKVAYTDFGFALDIMKLCKEGKPLPSPGAAGTPSAQGPEGFTDFKWPETKSCEELVDLAQKTEIFSHAMIIYRMKHKQNLPWLDDEECFPRAGYGFTSNLRSTIQLNLLKPCLYEYLPKLIKNLQEKKDPVDALLAKALDPAYAKRPSAKEFDTEFKQIIYKQLQEGLANEKIPVSNYFETEEVTKALKSPDRFISFIEKSPESGTFELRIGYLNSDGKPAFFTLPANPFKAEEVKGKLAEFRKRNPTLQPLEKF